MKKGIKAGTIGAEVAAARESKGLEVEDIHRKTGLSLDFIKDIEAGAYNKIPHDAYTLAGFKKLANCVGLDGEEACRRYLGERGEVSGNGQLRRSHKQRPSVVTSTLLAQTLMVAAIVGILVYIIYQVIAATSSPDLEIVFPGENQTVHGDTVEVIGKTDPGSTVTIDGQGVNLDDDGSFSYEISLPSGVHTIVIESESDLGRSTEVSHTFNVSTD